MSKAEKDIKKKNDQLACIYAALILQDENLEVTEANLSSILKASDYKVEPYWPGIYADFLKTQNLKGIIAGGVSGGSVEGAAAVAGAKEDKKKDESKKKEEPKKEESKKEEKKKPVVEEAEDEGLSGRPGRGEKAH